MLKKIIRIIAILSAIYGIYITYMGLLSFTYFTILSNIFVIIILGILLFKKEDAKISDSLNIIKFLATISITITFLVFMFILAPTMPGGIINAYIGGYCGSFCLHFLTPLLTIIDFFLYDKEFTLKKKHAVYAIIPPLGYFGYVLILSLLGVRWGNMSAPYNFINFAAPTGWFGFDLSIMGFESLGIGVFYMVILLIIIFSLLGLLFIKVKQGLK